MNNVRNRLINATSIGIFNEVYEVSTFGARIKADEISRDVVGIEVDVVDRSVSSVIGPNDE